jgi:hypothetical protein
LIKEKKKAHMDWVFAGRPGPQHGTSTARKATTRALRSHRRGEEAEKKKAFYQEVMENVCDASFYKLIRKHQKTNADTMALLTDGKLEYDCDKQIKDWATHFEQLATPTNKSQYDDEYITDVQQILNCIDMICDQDKSFEPITRDEVYCAIQRLNDKKASDESGLCAEHLKTSGESILYVLADMFNMMCHAGYFPVSLKSGIIHPVSKKGKSTLIKDNYRGITISSIMGKVLEHILRSRWQPLRDQQSHLQFGFTKGRSPAMASLLVSEADIEADEQKQCIYVCTLDAMKAFDTVDHRVMLQRLFQDTTPDIYKAVRELYNDTTSKVKWQGALSEPFKIQQGVRQGGVLSPDLYKLYINNLLKTYETHPCSFRIGCIPVGSPTVADDVCLVSGNGLDMQILLREAYNYSCQARYMLHPDKSAIIPMGRVSLHHMDTFTLGECDVQASVTADHLGLCRSNWREQSTAIIKEKISLGRRTTYSLMGTGLHGTNGVDASTSYKVYRTYVLPRMLYGLEVVHLKKGDINKIETAHRELLRMFQSLPPRTANAATYLLIGAIPIEAEIDMRRLSLLGGIVRSPDMNLREVAARQIAVKDVNSKSWFVKTAKLLTKYELPSTHELLQDPPTKPAWKRAINRAVKGYWSKLLKAEASTKSTLCYLNIDSLRFGSAHHIWTTVNRSLQDVRRAITKIHLVTGTYCTQAVRSLHSEGKVASTCLLCCSSEEDLFHLLLECPALHQVRARYLPMIQQLVSSYISQEEWENLCQDSGSLLQLVLDCSKMPRIARNGKMMEEIVSTTRIMCHQLHCRRSRMMIV